MLRPQSAWAPFPFLVAGLSLLSLQGFARGQADAHGRLDPRPPCLHADGEIDKSVDPDSAPTLLVGRVVCPDGSPALGAVVVTAAGGQAISDADGAFSLEVEVPVVAESVRITAVMSTERVTSVGSADVERLALWGTTLVGTVVLEQATSCQPSWLPTFGDKPGTDSSVLSQTVFDDGTGPALYVGGSFTTAGGAVANHIARWDGSSWSALGEGMNGDVKALGVFDDGTGPALYAGGYFTTAGGAAASHIAKWNGTTWSALGRGVGGEDYFTGVYALTVFDDGSGSALYAGGDFTTAGHVKANFIARWDGATWSALGSGMGGSSSPFVHALAVFDDGGGPELYAGGDFAMAGGVKAHWMATWNGTTWSALDSEVNYSVFALTAFDDGSGPALYAGGAFDTAGGAHARYIAKWNGTSWAELGSGMDDAVNSLAVFDDGSGRALFACGWFTSAGGVQAGFVAKWDGARWSALDRGIGWYSSYGVYSLAVFNDGSGTALYVGGFFTNAGGWSGFKLAGPGGVLANNFARWNGSSWSVVGSGMNGGVSSLAVFDDGSGPALYVGGFFTAVGKVGANRIAKWNGSSWMPLSSGLSQGASSLAVFDDGSGPALYVGGYFMTAGGVSAKKIAKWNGTTWSGLGTGMSQDVYCLGVFDDGSGPALYAGGAFTSAGGVSAMHVARWDGVAWSALGQGVNDDVLALTVFDAGSGPQLYAGGDFTIAGSTLASRIAKWNGAKWSAVGTGVNDAVMALAVFDDGSGPALYAGGDFTFAGGAPANRIAKWDASSWSALGSGTNGSVFELAVFDDGSGPALYAGGTFTTAGDAAANQISKWDGSSWTALGGGMNGGVGTLGVFDDGSGPALYAGGSFYSAIDSGDSFLAKWGGCPAPSSFWYDLGSGLAGVSGIPQLTGSGDLRAGTSGSLSVAGAAPSAPALLFLSTSSTPAPFKGGMLLPVPVQSALAMSIDAAGDSLLAWTSWPAGLSGASLYVQCAIQDAAAVHGVALSNALRADVP